MSDKYDVFLSYCRGDDEPFVKQLHAAISEAGFTVWWDRVCMPSRALTFMEEIRNAIHDASRLVVVIGPKAITSDYVRAEWQYALVDDKVVTPLLRLGDHELLPPELETLHCPDFRATREYSEALAEFVRILREPLPPLGRLHGAVPAIPPRFQPRPDDMMRLAESVLIDRKRPITLTDTERATVLHGISGVGKSVMAASFARATTTRRAFSDGIFWLSVGEKADPLPLVRQLAQLLGGLKGGSDLATELSQVGERLKDKRCLLVLDNVWRVEQIELFLGVLGTNDRILLTSRGSELATAIGAREILLESLSEEAALQHLSDWTGQRVDELPPEARELAKECGYLPFALALNGAMVANNNRWSDLLDALRSADLDFAETRFADYPFPNVLKSIGLSVDVLARSEPNSASRYRELAVYLSENGVPVAALAVFWSYRGGLKERETRKLVVKLAGKGLLRLEMRNNEQYIVLHDLQYDFLRGTTEDLHGLNAALLEAYSGCAPNDWPSGPNDGYFHSYLVEHLIVAKRLDEVHRLLALETIDRRNAWYEATEAVGNIQAFLNDLQRAWQLIKTENGNDPNLKSDSLRSVELRIKYALIFASINSLTKGAPIPLIEALVRVGTWTLPRAIAYAEAIPDPSERIRAQVMLALSFPDQRTRTLRELTATALGENDEALHAWLAETLAAAGLINDGLDVARAIRENQTRALTLGALIKHLSEDERPRVVDEAVTAAFATGEIFRSTALTALLPYMSETLVREVLARVGAMKSPLFRDFILTSLLPELVRLGQLREAHERALAIEDPSSRAQALTAMFGNLDPQSRSETLAHIMDVLVQVDEEALSQQLGRELERAGLGGLAVVAIQSSFNQTSWRVGAIEGLSPFLSAVEQRQVYDFVITWPDSLFKLQAIAALAVNLQDDLRRVAEQQAILSATRIGEQEKSEWSYVWALTTLLTWIGDEQRPAIAQRAFDAVRRAGLYVPTELAPYVAESAIREALELIRRRNTDGKREALEALITRLPPELMQTALDITQLIGDDEDRVGAMAALGPAITAQMMRACLEEVGRLPEATGDVVCDLAAYLPAELLPDALKLARQAGNARAIGSLAGRYPEPERTALWRDVINQLVAETDVYRFEQLVKELPKDLIVETVETLESAVMKEEFESLKVVECIVALLPGLPAPNKLSTLDKILTVISSHWPDQETTRVRLTAYGASQIFQKVTAELAPSHLQHGLDLAKRIPDPFHRATATCALMSLAPPELQTQMMLDIGRDMQKFTGDQLFDAESQQEKVVAMAVPYMPDQINALDLTRRISEFNQAQALEGLAPKLPDELLDQALEIAKNIEEGEYRAQALSALVPRLSVERQPEVWREAFEAAISHFTAVYTVCRTPLALSIKDRTSLVANGMSLLRTQERWKALRTISAMAPLIVTLAEDLSHSTFTAIEDVGRWWP